MPAAEIARRLGGGITERAVRYRIQRLVDEGVLVISAIINPRALGYSVAADVFIEVETSQINRVAEALAEIECVSYVAYSIGALDVSVQVLGRSTEEIYCFVTEVIGKLPGVHKTTTFIVPLVVKDVYQWRIPASLCAAESETQGVP
jgi:Lrp/AsnC family transcriptional regulator for asnA, asnC and gidA